MQNMHNVTTIPTWGDELPARIEISEQNYSALLYTAPADDESVRRLRLEFGDALLELVPAKALGVLGCSFAGRELFWEPPLDRIPDPARLDLSASILINGEPQPGARWLEGFLCGVELMGLGNWGMFGRNAEGELLTLHGNVSYVPVPSVEIGIDADGRLVCEGTLRIYNDLDCVRPGIDSCAVWEVTRRIILDPAGRRLQLEDTITNLTRVPRFADWAYHIQLRPVDGCRLLFPSASVAPRFGGECEPDFETWRPAADPAIREERGYIHKKLASESGRVTALLRYPDGSGIETRIPHAPYTLSWNSCGGAMSREFLLPEKPETPFIPRPWDGVGPEIGASALDHDGNTDPEVVEDALAPGESRRIEISIALLENREAEKLEADIAAVGGKRGAT